MRGRRTRSPGLLSRPGIDKRSAIHEGFWKARSFPPLKPREPVCPTSSIPEGFFYVNISCLCRPLGRCETLNAFSPAAGETRALERTPSTFAIVCDAQTTEGNTTIDVRLSRCSNTILPNRDYPQFSPRRAGGTIHVS